jgi:hypothetical protein
VKGIHICCLGRLNGAKIVKIECKKCGETSLHVFSNQFDYAKVEAFTPYGLLRCQSVGFIFLTWKKGQVVLYPKRTRFRKYQKGKFKHCKANGTQLCFWKYGMKNCKTSRISYQAIETTCHIINKEFWRNGKIWVRVFTDSYY